MPDRWFIDRVARCLGDDYTVETTASGRTLVRYPEFVVSPEGSEGRPVASRIISGGASFARVNGNGELAWTTRRPTDSEDRPASRRSR